MKCVNFNICRRRTGSHQKKICWVKWRMCGECAVIYHPEAYTKTYVKRTRTKIRTNQNYLWNYVTRRKIEKWTE